MQLSLKNVKRLQKEIFAWYKMNARDLPWRKTRDPYKILVSEIMLQQTQVNRVIPKYEAWLEKFPTVEALAKAEKEDVLRLWSGLGYNRRAVYLKQCAEELVELKIKNLPADTCWPQTIEGLQELPGIGPYTARAIACFAFDQQVAVVDTNVRKVILIMFSRLSEKKKGNVMLNSFQHLSKKIPKPVCRQAGQVRDDKLVHNEELQQIAEQLLPKGRAYDWNQALMDYSSAVLSKQKVFIKKQSRFKDSNRYYRGKLMRLLLERKRVPLVEVGYLLRDNYSYSDEPWKQKLLQQMEKDGLIRINDEKVSI